MAGHTDKGSWDEETIPEDEPYTITFGGLHGKATKTPGTPTHQENSQGSGQETADPTAHWTPGQKAKAEAVRQKLQKLYGG